MRRRQLFLTSAITAVSFFVAACGDPASSTRTPTSISAISTVSTPVTGTAVTSVATAATTPATNAASAVTSTPNASTSATPTAHAASSSTVRYDVVANGTQADYRVREQLVRLSAPSDAVGTTTTVAGGLVIGADGKIDANQSKITVDLSSLQSDSSMRDRFIQGSTLDTTQYPTATFIPTKIAGLATPLPTSGQQTFQLIGDLTIHGVTKPVVFNVTAQANGKDVTGQASTDFKFEDFGMTPPHSMAVLSVVDDVKLEVTLHLSQSA